MADLEKLLPTNGRVYAPEALDSISRPRTIQPSNIRKRFNCFPIDAIAEQEVVVEAITEEEKCSETHNPQTKTSDDIEENVSNKTTTSASNKNQQLNIESKDEKSIDEKLIEGESSEEKDDKAGNQTIEKSDDIATHKAKDNEIIEEKTNDLDNKEEIEQNLAKKNVQKNNTEEEKHETSEKRLELTDNSKITDEKERRSDTPEENRKQHDAEEITAKEQASADIQEQEEHNAREKESTETPKTKETSLNAEEITTKEQASADIQEEQNAGEKESTEAPTVKEKSLNAEEITAKQQTSAAIQEQKEQKAEENENTETTTTKEKSFNAEKITAKEQASADIQEPKELNAEEKESTEATTTKETSLNAEEITAKEQASADIQEPKEQNAEEKESTEATTTKETSLNAEEITAKEQASADIQDQKEQNAEEKKGTEATTTKETSLNAEEITAKEQASADIQEQKEQSAEEKESKEAQTTEIDTETASTDNLAISEEEKQNNEIDDDEIEDSQEAHHNKENDSTNEETDTDDQEMEENVELIKMPDEHDDEEMILPDSVDENAEREQPSDIDEDENEKQENTSAEEDNGEDEPEQNYKETDDDTLLPSEKESAQAKMQNSTESENENEAAEEQENPLQQVNEENESVEEATSRTNDEDETPEHEHDLIALKTDQTIKDDETKQLDEDNNHNDDENTGSDPLTYSTEEQTKESNIEIAKSATESVTVDDDDDEVQVIEVRNSPICLDSDDDDDNALEQSLLIPMRSEPAAPVARVTRSLPTERIFARKSTAKPAFKPTTTTPLLVPPIKKAPINLSYLQNANQTLQRPQRRKVVDTIELLDSSDEETNKRKSQVMPKRRQLLANNVTFSKYNNRLGRPPKGMAAQTTAPFKRAIIPALKLPSVAYIPTPQSNFLNTFNLQPASTGANPPAFSATLSNKNVIIPNAFYGNPPEMRNNNSSSSGTTSRSNKTAADNARCTEEDQMERSYRRWLENFLSHFSSPKQIASYSCFVLLQRVLKYKLFVRVKDLRTKLNAQAHNSTHDVNMQLMLDLRQIFYTSDKKLSEVGRRFCELAYTHMIGKSVTLTTDARTGRVTSRTRSPEEVALERQVNQTTTKKSNENSEKPPANFSGIFKITNFGSSTATTTTAARKRQHDDGEYIPKNIGSSKNKETVDEQPKKSLRAKRTRRYDNNFSYNEDQDDFEEEEEDNSYVAVQRKIERKRLEAKQQCEKQAKSFENAFIEMFARNLKDKPLGINSNGIGESSSAKTQKKPINGNTNSMEEHIIPDDDDVVGLDDDDEPREHRIYKVIPTKLRAAAATSNANVDSPSRLSAKSRRRQGNEQYISETEVITCDDNESNSVEVFNDDNDDVIAIDNDDNVIIDPKDAPRNCNRSMHIASKKNEWCILCSRRFTHIVHHYVNDHRGCEVYTSRLSEPQAKRLRRLQGYQAVLSIYKNGQQQFEAECAFCAKRSRFMLPYWYQHYSMHTGEYAYRCNGCGIRKPTRPLLMSHINSSSVRACCQVKTVYTYNTKVERIDAHLCTLCNYVQLNRRNIVQHLKMQHNLKQIVATHIQTIGLLKLPSNAAGVSSSGASSSKFTRTSARPKRTTTVRDSQGAVYEIAEINAEDGQEQDVSTGSWPYDAGVDNDNSSTQQGNMDFSGGTWDDGDPGDDLSFMICGMLDVEMNPE